MKNGIMWMPWIACAVPAAMNEDKRTGLRDTLFENLTVLSFFVVEERVPIDRLVELSHV